MKNKIKKKWSEREINFLKKNYSEKGPRWCSEKLNRTYAAIIIYASKLELNVSLKYPVNQNYFDKLNDENTNVLGFLLADGCSYQDKRYNNSWLLSIPLARKDRNVLEYIRSKISPTRPIYDYRSYNKQMKKYYNGSRLQISGLNKNFVNNLLRYGIFPRKTGKEFIPDIPKKYLWNWFLGVFDGDGGISLCIDKQGYYHYTFHIASGSRQFLLQLQEVFFKKYHCGISKNKKTENGWQLRIDKQSSIKEIAKKMYENAPFCLERKRQRFIKWDLL